MSDRLARQQARAPHAAAARARLAERASRYDSSNGSIIRLALCGKCDHYHERGGPCPEQEPT